MNVVNLTGRLTRDPECRTASGGTLAVASFSLAVQKKRDVKENEPSADFISITCFGKLAEHVHKYLQKGRLVAVCGRLQSDSYEKDGKRIYRMEVIANSVEFLGRNPNGPADNSVKAAGADAASENKVQEEAVPEGFTQLTEDDLPF